MLHRFLTFFLIALCICISSSASEVNDEGEHELFNSPNNVLVIQHEEHGDLHSKTLDYLTDRTKHRDIDSLILAFKSLGDGQQLKFAQGICDDLMSAPLDSLGYAPYDYCFGTIGKVMFATHKDVSSLYKFIEAAVEKNTPSARSFLNIALARFQNRLLWHDIQSNQTLLIEPQFGYFVQNIAHHCPLVYYLEKLIRTAESQYRLKFQRQDLPKSWKEKYWDLCLSWYEDRKSRLNGEIVLELYKFLIEEEIVKKPKLDRGCAYKSFQSFYQSLTGSKKIKVRSNFDVDADLSSFLWKKHEERQALRDGKPSLPEVSQKQL